MAAEFTHLHLHTDYSLLDGACDVDKLAAHLSKIGQSSAAMTDHGNIYGAVHFFDAMKKTGLKPILGCELYISETEDHTEQSGGYNHLLVLAENEEGYRNLIRLTSEAAIHGFYRRPRISKQFLARHTKGLIGFSGCLVGEVNRHLMKGAFEEAKRTAGQHEEMFGKGNYFLEVQDHGLGPDKGVREALYKLERELDIPLVATNDSHYVAGDDSQAHEILLCVQTGSNMNDPNRFKFQTNEFYIKSAEEMHRLFADYPDPCTRTMQFAERCNLKLHAVENPFPEFPVPEGHTLESYFEQVCRAGFRKRMETTVAHLREQGLLRRSIADYEQRLEREIDCIKQMKFPGYFLIVWDFIRYAREQGIPVGPGRGSAAGSLVAYSMEITDIDPLQNELLFERFLNPERVSMPDIDVDFCMNRRPEVIEYVRRKYGTDQVAQIITFNTMAAKAAIKDVGRAMEIPYGEVDRIAKMIPVVQGVTIHIQDVLNEKGPLTKAYEGDAKIKELIDTAMKLEGLARGAGVHAAGVVIAPEPLTELVPVTLTKEQSLVTAYDMKAIEKMGLLKMDFLGLTTLTVINDCLKLIRQTTGEVIDMARVPLNDARTYEQVFHSGLTSGIFQFESSGMRDVLRRYKPNTVEDLTALNAIYRPGPIKGGVVDEFIECKWGRMPVTYDFPELEPILRETLGIILYQEQVMQISSVIGGYSLGGADLLRRAMGKKNAEEMARQRDTFLNGAVERGFAKGKAVDLFDKMEAFAGYGFNKSHAAAYALLAYQTAWLKTHYPVEFMAALLTSETSKPENVVKYIGECREMNISVVPPNVQISDADFTPVRTEQGSAIGFGLAAIKNVGHNAIESILAARTALAAESKQGFASLWEFCEKVDLSRLNKRVLESLIKAGAMDAFGSRARTTAALDKAIERAQKAQRDAASGQSGLFGIFDSDVRVKKEDALPSVPDWDEHTLLQNEKEVLGFFVSGHPMDKYREKLRNLRNLKVVDTATAVEMTPEPQSFRRGEQPQNEIAIAGVIAGLKIAKSKKGDLYANAALEDTTGKIEMIVFPQSYEKLAERLKIEVPVLVRGVLRGEEEAAPKLAVSSIQALEDVKVKLPEALRIKVPLHHPDGALLEKLKAIFADAPGKGKLLLDLEEPGDFCAVLEPHNVMVAADCRFIDRVEELVGQGGVCIIE